MNPVQTSNIAQGMDLSDKSLTAVEYAEKVRQFMIDSYCWQSLVATAAIGKVSSERSSSPGHNHFERGSAGAHPSIQNTASPDHTILPPVLEGRIFLIPPLWKRLLAEGIDFVFLLILKILVTLIISDYVSFLDISTDLDLETVLDKMDYDKAYAIASDLFTLELIHKCVVCVYETVFLASGRRFGAATPGKAMMGLKVVKCQRVTRVSPTMIRVEPALDLGYGRALLRACLKNFGSTLFFPIGLPFFIVAFNRTIYDVLSGSIVVE